MIARTTFAAAALLAATTFTGTAFADSSGVHLGTSWTHYQVTYAEKQRRISEMRSKQETGKSNIFLINEREMRGEMAMAAEDGHHGKRKRRKH